ncbi:MAG: beta-ketoacyl-ACP synthase [Acetobacteraceae bacterium]
MAALAISAASVVTALGCGKAATLAALGERRDGLRRCDFGGLALGFIGRVTEVEAHTLRPALAAFDCRNHRLADLALRSDSFAEAVERARARHGAERIAVVVGTSTSGVLTAEEAYLRRDRGAPPRAGSLDRRHTHDLHSLAWFVRNACGLAGPALTVSTACASSARAMLDASHLIACGIVDAAVVGGADSLCRLTLAGFAALELVSPAPCRPCDARRQGISLGEGAGFCLLERGDSEFALLGAGASSDAYHMSSPRADGAGAALAMRRALQSAGLEPGEIDAINLHGTGTRANDAAEDAAVFAVFGNTVPASSTKGFTGHTMGSCGIIEAVIGLICMQEGLLPGCLRVEEVDPGFRAHVVTENEDRVIRRLISNSFGFGGINVSLVLGRR